MNEENSSPLRLSLIHIFPGRVVPDVFLASLTRVAPQQVGRYPSIRCGAVPFGIAPYQLEMCIRDSRDSFSRVPHRKGVAARSKQMVGGMGGGSLRTRIAVSYTHLAISSRMGSPLNLSVTFESALRTGEVSLF